MTTGKITPDDKTGNDSEPFLSRWSRRKEEARRESPEPLPQKGADAEAPAPQLPRLDQLTFESDFRGFLHPKVSEDMRRAALKKLFSAPHFNVMDGLDVYIDDFSKPDPLPEGWLEKLNQVTRLGDYRPPEEAAEEPAEAAAEPASEPPVDPSADPDSMASGASPPDTPDTKAGPPEVPES